MAKQTELFLHQGYGNNGVQIVNADGNGTWKTVYTSPALNATPAGNDVTLKAVSVTSDDATARNLLVGLDIGGTVFVIGCVNIPVAAGTNGTTPAVDLLNSVAMPFLPLDITCKRVNLMEAGTILKVKPLVAVTSGATITLVAWAEKL